MIYPCFAELILGNMNIYVHSLSFLFTEITKAVKKVLSHGRQGIMATIASQITSLTIVYSTVYSDVDQRKHQSSASLAFVRGIHQGPVNSPHKWPATRKMFPFDDVIMDLFILHSQCNDYWWPGDTMSQVICSQVFSEYSGLSTSFKSDFQLLMFYLIWFQMKHNNLYCMLKWFSNILNLLYDLNNIWNFVWRNYI